MNVVEQVFVACEEARANGVAIRKVSDRDKEFHFQNWVQARLDSCGLSYDEPGRNVYPDFRIVTPPLGFEVKGLAYPGRTANYDANSQMPSGNHNGRELYYIFGRYPKNVKGQSEYPVVDLVVCHGSFLNADSDYIHQNKSFRGFGSYGDILVRDRKMYVVPTPYFLADGTTQVGTLIVPASFSPQSGSLVKVGMIERTEVASVVSTYKFNLQTNDLDLESVPNPNVGVTHQFDAYRLKGRGDDKPVTLSAAATAYAQRIESVVE